MNTIKVLFFSIVVNFLGGCSYAQPKEISFVELEAVMKTAPKPVLIFVHTDWCSYCALMERKTLKNEPVVQKLNTDFYYLSFNAEKDEVITYKGKEYSLNKRGIKTTQHELAKQLAQSNAYPAVIFLDEKLEVIYRHFAYIKPNELYKILNAIKPTTTQAYHL